MSLNSPASNLGTKPIICVIAGPTGSGKSLIALELAKVFSGQIINADSLQVYNEIPILSCSPSQADKRQISHHLYNYIPVTHTYSVLQFIQEAVDKIKSVSTAGNIPFLVGGTGMYIKALCEGIHNIPDIPPSLRESVIQRHKDLGAENFFSELRQKDPFAASKLHMSNTQRVIRAYMVYEATGRSLYEFHREPPKKFLEEYQIVKLVLDPDRKFLYSTCDARFLQIMQSGVIEEVAAVKEKYASEIPASKAIGFKQILSYLTGNISYAECINLSQIETRNYAKRQVTWFKHQMPEAHRIVFNEFDLDDILEQSRKIIESYAH